MIYTLNNKRSLEYSSPLLEYMKNTHNYTNENLLYSTRYTNGTFTITNPTDKFENCEFVNGYPHFHIPLDVCLDEIDYFINDESIYNKNFIIRFGDSHPHNSIPKLGQTRNLILSNYIVSLLGKQANPLYAIGDISIKSLKDFVLKYQLEIDPEKLFIDIVNNNASSEMINKLLEYDKNATDKITDFMKKMELKTTDFIFESSLYKNQELYNYFKYSPQFSKFIKRNGEIKYTLQELMFIRNILKNEEDTLINIIGFDQSEHILKVNKVMNEEQMNIDSRFLSYEICKNGLDQDMDVWSSKLNDFIEKNSLIVNGRYLSYQELLKILFIVNGNDNIIDFDKLEKYINHIKKMCEICTIKVGDSDERKETNNLICKMSLVNYTINRTIEMGNPNYFYKYILDLSSEIEKNHDEYKNIEGLYSKFLKKCLEKLDLIKLYTEEREEKKHVLSKKI